MNGRQKALPEFTCSCEYAEAVSSMMELLADHPQTHLPDPDTAVLWPGLGLMDRILIRQLVGA